MKVCDESIIVGINGSRHRCDRDLPHVDWNSKPQHHRTFVKLGAVRVEVQW